MLPMALASWRTLPSQFGNRQTSDLPEKSQCKCLVEWKCVSVFQERPRFVGRKSSSLLKINFTSGRSNLSIHRGRFSVRNHRADPWFVLGLAPQLAKLQNAWLEFSILALASGALVWEICDMVVSITFPKKNSFNFICEDMKLPDELKADKETWQMIFEYGL